MTKRFTISLLLALVMISSLATGVVASGAQAPHDLTENYTWQPYGLTIGYASTWVVTPKPQAISFHPADRDVSDGLGPELILFELPDTDNRQLNEAIEQFTQNTGATRSEIVSNLLDGRLTRHATLAWSDTGAVGGLLVVGERADLALGVAYIVRRSEATTYLPVFEAMLASLTFGPRAAATPVVTGPHSSVSVASVQLPQPVVWQEAGLTLHFPADWTVEFEAAPPFDGMSLLALPPDDLPFRAIQGFVAEAFTADELHAFAKRLLANDTVAEVTDLTIAGYDAVTFNMVEDSEVPPVLLRTVLIAQYDTQGTAILMFSAEQEAWDAFRPLVSAFLSSIEPLDDRVSVAPSGTGIALASYRPGDMPIARQQGGGSTQSFLWEEYGITFTMPADWQALGKGQNFDQALVSPELLDSGEGAFIMLQVFPALGVDTTMEDALGSIAEQVGGEVEPFSTAGLDGMGITISSDEEANHFALLPYGEAAAVLFVQTSAPPDDDETILAILDSMTIAPPKPDYAAVDAAWQASLAEDGRLIYGADDAPVTLIEFLSFTCGHCANYSLPMEHLFALEAETGRVRIELAPLAGDEMATLATRATYCATEQGKGYSTYHALFNGYLELGRETAYSEDGLRDLLAPLGLDMDALDACIEANPYADPIERVRTEFLDHGLTGTPTVLLGTQDIAPETLTLPNGQVWSGTIPIEILRALFTRIIDDGLTPAEALAQQFSS